MYLFTIAIFSLFCVINMQLDVKDFKLSSFIQGIQGIQKNSPLQRIEVNKSLLNKYDFDIVFERLTNISDALSMIPTWETFIKDFEHMGYDLCIGFFDIGVKVADSTVMNNAAIVKRVSPRKTTRPRPLSIGGGLGSSCFGFFFLRRNKNRVSHDPNIVQPLELGNVDWLLNQLKPVLMPKVTIAYQYRDAQNTLSELFKKLKEGEHRFKATSFMFEENNDELTLMILKVQDIEYKLTVKKVSTGVAFELRTTSANKTVNLSSLPAPFHEESSTHITHIAIKNYYNGNSTTIANLHNLAAKPKPAELKPVDAYHMKITDFETALQSMFTDDHHEFDFKFS